MKRILNIATLMLIVSTLAFASNKKDDEPKPAHLFGVGISLTDSTAFFTDIQTVDSLFLNDNGFIDNEAEYSLQLKLYLSNRLNMPDKACAVFYDDNLKDLEKEYNKVMSKLKDGGYKDFIMINRNDFTFTRYKETE